MRALILLSLLGVALAGHRSVTRIVGGEETTIEQYPFSTMMEYHLWGIFWLQSCGGSLLTSTTLLSAAHCYYGDRPSDWRVRLGATFTSTGGSLHLVTRLLIHPQYNDNTWDNDVAIVALATPAVMSNSVNIARIAGPNYHLADGTRLTVIGWGTTSFQGPASNVLRRVEVNLINQELCVERYAYLRTLPGFEYYPDVTDGMVCSGILDVGGKDACQGDSGGPLLHDGDVVFGITSWGHMCADSFAPGVNARVSKYADWIVANAST